VIKSRPALPFARIAKGANSQVYPLQYRSYCMKTSLPTDRLILKQDGLGLLEVIVAAGILSIIGFAISSLIISGQRGAVSVQKRLDAGQLGSFINTVLTNSAACKLSGLIGQAAPSSKLPSTPDVTSLPVPLSYAGYLFDDSGGPNSQFDNGQVKIASLKYHSVLKTPGVDLVVVRLQVDAAGASSNLVVGGNLLAPNDFPVVLYEAAGFITACGSPPGQTQVVHFGPATVPSSSSYATLPLGCQPWTTPFVNLNYSVTCSGINVRDAINRRIGWVVVKSKSLTQVCVDISNEGSQPLSVDGIDCVANP
jgi:type II secretory pathway pseudopilin PulG